MAWLVCWGILGVNGMVLCAMAMQAKTQVLVGGTVDMPLRVVAVLCWLITALSFVRFGTHLFRLQRDLRQVGEFEEFAKVTLEAIEGLKAENPELTPPADGTAIHLQGGEQRKE